jgi:dUTP pyrophosphatase
MIAIKLLNEFAKIPSRANETDAGADLFSVEDVVIGPMQRKMISTGIALQIPENYYGRVAPRSGLAVKNGIDVLAGVVDSSYRGEIKVVLINTDKNEEFNVKKGDKIAQLIIESHHNFDFVITDSLEETNRGSGGFGSTGR